MNETRSLEGWAPELGRDATLEEALEHAFEYRGDITLALTDGTEVAGYLFNRDAAGPTPFVELFPPGVDSPVRVPYARIAAIRFSGRDAARGTTYEAWKRRHDSGEPSPGPGGQGG